jgi:catechol 2,3-dioxygenase-like lactoylglutathione lyase family enzyme
MKVQQLEHYNIRTADLEGTLRFYSDVLGMKWEDIPFETPGAFIYDEQGVAVVHVALADDEEAHRRLDEHYGKEPSHPYRGGGAIDHIAFEGDDFAGYRQHFETLGLPFAERSIEPMNVRQLFITDPNGITIEMNFH